MSDLLVNKTSQASNSAPGSFADMVDMAQASVNVGSASSVILIIASFSLDQGGSSDHVAECQFAVDDTLEGPSLLVFKDNVDKGCGQSIVWALTGISGSHKFALQWRATVSSPLLDTGRVRSFQVIEITDASLLVDITTTTADDATPGYDDIASMATTQTPASADSILLLIANVQSDVDASNDENASYQFEIGGTGEGPEPLAFIDAADEGCGASLMWLKTGLSGAIDFALQWKEVAQSVTAGDFVRSFQVIEITANANILSAITSVASHSLTGSYADVGDLVDTVTVVGTDSILVFGASFPGGPSSDDTGVFRFFEGGTGEGPEVYCFQDDSGEHDGCGHSIYWAATGKSAGSHTFSLRGQNVTGTYPMATGFRRSFSLLELTADVSQVDKEATDTLALDLDPEAAALAALLDRQEAIDLAILEGAGQVAVMIDPPPDALDLALGEEAALLAAAQPIDTLDLAVGEQVDLEAQAAVVDDADLAIIEGPAQVAAGIVAADDVALAQAEDAQLQAQADAQDDLDLATDEGPTDLLAKADPVDTTGLAADDVAALLAAASRLDGVDLAIGEVAEVVAALEALDTVSLAIDEATGQIAVMVDAADNLDLALGEVAELLALLGVADTLSIIIDDAAAVLNLIARSDTLALAIDDAGQVAVQVTAADTADLAIGDVVSDLCVALVADDTLGIVIVEAAELLAFLQRADTLALALVEGVPVIMAGLAAEDTLGIEIVDQSTVQVPIEAADVADLAIDEVAQLVVVIQATDLLALAVDEIQTLAGFLNRTDIAGLQLGEDAQLLAFLAAEDNLDLAIAEVAQVVVVLEAADALGISVAEVGQVLIALAAIDTLGLAIAEAPADVFKEIAFEGVIVQPFTLVACREAAFTLPVVREAAFTLPVVREVQFTLQIEGSGEQIP